MGRGRSRHSNRGSLRVGSGQAPASHGSRGLAPGAGADHTVNLALGLPPRSPRPGPGHPPEPSASSPGSSGLVGSGRYLVIRGLLQHLRAQVGAELELPTSKIAPGQEQRFHLRAHGCRGPPAKDQGPTQGGRGPRSRRRPALPSNARRPGPSQGGARIAPENRKKKKTTANRTPLWACP